MDVITIESEAFRQIIDKLKKLDRNFGSLSEKADKKISERWLDGQEVRFLLKISTRTLQNYRDEQLLPYSQIGNKMYYKAVDVEKFLKKNYHKVHNF